MTTKRSELELKTRVVEELLWTAGVDSAHVGVSVSGGAVTLSGEVDSYPEVLLAGKAVARVRGVTAVAQEITVRSDDGAPGDSDVARVAGEALHHATDVPVSVRVSVHDRVVTLTGIASRRERRAAVEAVAHLGGVREVVDLIRVRPVAGTTVTAVLEAIAVALGRNAATPENRVDVTCTEEGVVGLAGTVGSGAERVRAEDAARAVPGVTAVVGDLKVRADTPAPEAAPGLEAADAEAAVAVAVRAPSLHNTQPWQWVLAGDVLELRADRTRQLAVADSDGHSLLISCGAALALTDLALRARGWLLDVERLPDDRDPDLLARLRGTGRGAVAPHDVELVAAAQGRRSERRPFAPGPVPPPVIERLRQAADSATVYAHFPVRPEEKLELATAVSHADRVERDDPEYIAELAQWVGSGLGLGDGVPVDVVPRVLSGSPRHTDVPLRDFEVGVRGTQLIAAGVDERPLLAVVLTTGNGRADQLAAGEAMMRLMLEAETSGLASCPLSQAVDMPAFRSRLRTFMNYPSFPQMMVRLGSRPTGEPAPLTGRRGVAEVLRTR